MKRFVLDTNVVVSAVLWGGQPRELLHAARADSVSLFTSLAMLAELADVLMRPKFAKRMRGARIDPDTLVAGYASLATIVRPDALTGVAPDPDDDVVIATALAARADLIVTGDRPFLALAAYRDVRIVDVATSVALLNPTIDR